MFFCYLWLNNIVVVGGMVNLVSLWYPLMYRELYDTVRYKILEGENFGEFGELRQNRQNFLVQNFLLRKICN